MSFTTIFLILIPFISFSSLIAIARTSKTMLNNSGENGHPCLVPDLRGNAFNFSPLRMTFAVCFSSVSSVAQSCPRLLIFLPAILFQPVFLPAQCFS